MQRWLRGLGFGLLVLLTLTSCFRSPAPTTPEDNVLFTDEDLDKAQPTKKPKVQRWQTLNVQDFRLTVK